MNFKMRLLILTCFWFFLSAALLGTLFSQQQRFVEQRTQQNLHRELAAHMRDDNPLMKGTDYNPSALKAIFHTLMLLGPDFEIYFLDHQGNIRSHAAPQERVKVSQVTLEPIRQFLNNKPFPILGDDPRNPNQQKVFSVAPIKEFDSVIGYLYVVIGSEQRALLADKYNEPFIFLLGVSLLLVMGFILLCYQLVKRTLLRPIEKVTRKLQQQADNDFRLKPDFIDQVPELKPVARQLYLMSQKIQQQFLQLQQQETKRREQLMQLSHDLKTPLSSVLGYLETWKMQNTEPDPLIDTARRNAEKLAEQLHQQLKIARDQQLAPAPVFETVSLTEIIQETMQAFSPKVKKKQLSIQTAMPEADIVYGDHELLLRLFANLFENAIRHAPTGSEIRLNVEHHNHSLSVRLKNNVDPNAPAGSLGLGMRIIQSILMLHHSQLKTECNAGNYLQTFELPQSGQVG